MGMRELREKGKEEEKRELERKSYQRQRARSV